MIHVRDRYSRPRNTMDRDPQTIGRYRIIKPLGKGGMGAVYLAEDPNIGRRVAIKIVLPGNDPDQPRRLFRREVEISGKFNHPNVVTAYDAGELPEIGPFLVSEYVDGKTLAELCKNDELEIQEKLRVLIQVGAALDAAHGKGIVHRDVKPLNVLVTRTAQAKLADFGVAWRLGSEPLVGEAGTVPYFAPELLCDDPEPSPGTDNYALAVTALEAFTGQRPHRGADLRRSIRNDPPTLPPGLNQAWYGVFARALDKNPDARYPSAAHFLAELVNGANLDQATKADLLRSLPVQALDPVAPLMRQRPAVRIYAVEAPVATPPTEPPAEPSPEVPTAALPPTAVTMPSPPARLSPAVVAAGAVVLVVAVAGALWAVGRGQPTAPSADLASTRPAAPPAVQQGTGAPPDAAVANRVPTPIHAAPAGPSREAVTAAVRAKLEGEGLDDLAVAVDGDGMVAVSGAVSSAQRPKLDAALRAVEGVKEVDLSGLRTRSSGTEVAGMVRKALQEERLLHVQVKVDDERRVLLANVASPEEATRLRGIVENLGEPGLEVRTSLRPRPAAPQAAQVARQPAAPPTKAAPVWGQMQYDGAQRTD